MFDYRRTHTCADLSEKDIGSKVTLSGWVNRRRDHGGLIFIDLRDRFGLTQLVFDPNLHHSAHEIASRLRSEWVLSVKGKVIPRAEGMVNTKLKTGAIEIEVHDIEILSKAKTPPFSICDDQIEVNEELRLKYRYLDIRRGAIAQKLITRHQLMMATRKFLDTQNFLEISTPILGKSTPEGARDYLVPSRIYHGSFYALPQSPQLFKQLLMVAGMDRYFQIATCFRDEDLRADRQPEFTQIDIEMSFGIPDDLFKIVEGLTNTIFKSCKNIEIFPPFRRMTYQEAVEKYGTDKPDLRFGMELTRIDDIAKECSFTVFNQQIESGGCVKCMCVKNGADISRKTIEDYTQFVSKFGVQGLAWMKVQSEGLSSSIVKFFSADVQQKLIDRMDAEVGDLLFFMAENEARVNQAFDHLRRSIARDRKLIDPNVYEFLWVTDFPLFKWDEETQHFESEHHPFTSPHLEDIHLLDSQPLLVRSSSYDLVLNGYEIASGSQRIHNGDLQEKIFQLLQLSTAEIEQRFGFFIEALKYGTPPHLGIALGLDRLTMILTQTDNIRDVIAFPKTQKASDLMMEAPSPVNDQQLKELKLLIESNEVHW